MKLRNSIESIAVMVSAFILLSGCSTTDVKNLVSNGDAISTSNTKLVSTDKDKVKLFYASGSKPSHYKIIGRVTSENYSIVGMEHSQAFIADELKTQAASIGAN